MNSLLSLWLIPTIISIVSIWYIHNKSATIFNRFNTMVKQYEYTTKFAMNFSKPIGTGLIVFCVLLSFIPILNVFTTLFFVISAINCGLFVNRVICLMAWEEEYQRNEEQDRISKLASQIVRNSTLNHKNAASSTPSTRSATKQPISNNTRIAEDSPIYSPTVSHTYADTSYSYSDSSSSSSSCSDSSSSSSSCSDSSSSSSSSCSSD